jgi:hypothetical protein
MSGVDVTTELERYRAWKESRRRNQLNARPHAERHLSILGLSIHRSSAQRSIPAFGLPPRYSLQTFEKTETTVTTGQPIVKRW